MLSKLMFVLSFVFIVACGVSFSDESTTPASDKPAVSAPEKKAEQPSSDKSEVSATTEKTEQPKSNITVSDSKFCTSVSEKEPVGTNTSFSTENKVIYYWTKINTDAAPTTISHVWTYNGEKMVEIPLNIKYESGRTWSYKTLMPEWTGEWTVETKDSNGNTIKKDSFTYNKSEASDKSTDVGESQGK